MTQQELEDQKEQTTTHQQQKLSMPQFEADRQKGMQKAQDEWAESDEAKAVQSWASRE